MSGHRRSSARRLRGFRKALRLSIIARPERSSRSSRGPSSLVAHLDDEAPPLAIALLILGNVAKYVLSGHFVGDLSVHGNKVIDCQRNERAPVGLARQRPHHVFSVANAA